VLIEDEVAHAVEDQPVVVPLGLLEDVGVMAGHDVGTLVDDETSQVALPVIGLESVLDPPMKRDHDQVHLGLQLLYIPLNGLLEALGRTPLEREERLFVGELGHGIRIGQQADPHALLLHDQRNLRVVVFTEAHVRDSDAG